jgi:hypothetical protein
MFLVFLFLRLGAQVNDPWGDKGTVKQDYNLPAFSP